VSELSTETPAAGPAVPTGVRAGAVPAAAWFRLLRPKQWVKNAFVLAPLLFSGRAVELDAVARSISAFALFCLSSSAVYALNDVWDRRLDRAHPAKRMRPVAAGIISSRQALLVSGALAIPAALGAWLMSPSLLALIAAYFALNVLYTLRLKHIVIVDVFVVAAFFILRLLAGTTAIAVEPSVWLLLCGGLLALYLGFAKRRNELLLLGDDHEAHRTVLSKYTSEFLDQVSMVLLSTTVIAYVMYTLNSATAMEVGSEALSYSTVFVLYGVFRYQYLAHHSHGGDPTETLLTDRPLLIAVVCWFAYCAYVAYR
jgi:4-hydroxybenzoate polyprenyltransferase